MIDVKMLSTRYDVRPLAEGDLSDILRLCRGNEQFYRYCEARPTEEELLSDLRVTPPGIDRSRKYYVGFFQEGALAAVMDLIDGYPREDIAYIGFFMLDKARQGRQEGSAIVREAAACLRAAGKAAIRLAIDRGNPQSTHFWTKNGFRVIAEAEVNGWPKLVAEKAL